MKNILLVFGILLLISSCKKEPTKIPVASIAITPSPLDIFVRDTKQLATAIGPANATTKSVTWSSSDDTKATVDGTGKVSGIAAGTVTITATATDGSKVKGTVTVNVTVKKATAIAITPATPSVGVGATTTLAAAITPSDAAQPLTWVSSDPTKATVDGNGKVTGVAKGTSTITATATDGSNVKGTATVTVTARVTSITISPATTSVGVGGNTTLTAAVTPSDAAQSVTWTSSDPTKATIDATGKVTGIAIGTTTITATATDGSSVVKTAILTVKSSDATLLSITLGDENFDVRVPAAEGTTPIANAPRTLLVALTALKVNLTAAANSTIQVGTTDFPSGRTLDFSTPQTFIVTAEDGRTKKNYTVAITAYDSISNPYGIYTVKHLVDVKNALSSNYLMKNDIDLPNADAAGATATGIPDYATAGWKPLGRSDTISFSFNGTFNGGNFEINNFYTNRTANHVGFFGCVGTRGKIKNLGVNGITSKVAATGTSSSTQLTGMLVGYNKGTIDKCFATGRVSSSSSSLSSSNGKVNAGGLVGRNDDAISNSYATGSTTVTILGSNAGATGQVGGLVGYHNSSGSINNCFALGDISASAVAQYATCIVGGLVGGGANTGTISNSYATGNVSVSFPSSSPNTIYMGIGGFIGDTSGGRITNCYRNSEATITKNETTGVTPTDNAITGVTAKTKADMQTNTFTNDLNGTSGTTWGRDDNTNEKWPYIKGVGVGKGK